MISALTLYDLRVSPSNRLEAIKGKRTGQHSIRINDQWRVCFEWREDGVYDAEEVEKARMTLGDRLEAEVKVLASA